MTYYTYNSETKVLTPASPTITTETAYIIQPSASQYATLHNPPAYSLAEDDVPPTPPEGKVTVQDGYELRNNQWHPVWKYEDEPEPEPELHTYKKSYIAQWFWMNNKLKALEYFMNRNQTAKFFWDYSTEFDSTHPQWNTLISAVCQGLGLSEEQKQQMLDYGETGVMPQS